MLNLPHQSLQQEIELTEDLVTLFIDYQVPSDLLCDDQPAAITGGGNVSASAGVERVRENVKAIKEMINRSKENELKEKKQQDEYDNRRKHVDAFNDDVKFAGGSVLGSLLLSSGSLSSRAPPTGLGSSTSASSGTPGTYDYTALPQRLQDAFEKHGEGNILRPTIVTVCFFMKLLNNL